MVFTARCYAERGIAMAIKVVCLSTVSVCNVEVSWLEFMENNFMGIILTFPLSADTNIIDLFQREHHKF